MELLGAHLLDAISLPAMLQELFCPHHPAISVFLCGSTCFSSQALHLLGSTFAT